MSFPRTGLYELRLKLKGKGREWNEEYFLGDAAAYSYLMTNALAISKGRRLLLGEGGLLWDAALHNLAATRDRKIVVGAVGGPINLDTEAGPPIAIGPVNNVTACLNATFETLLGRWNTRQWRYLRDDWVENNALAFAPTIPSLVAPPNMTTDFAAGLTREVALGNFIRAVCYYDKLKVPDPAALVTSYDVHAWESVTVGVISHRDTGVGRDFQGRRSS